MEQLDTFKPVGSPVAVSCDVGKEDFFDSLLLQQRAQGQGKRYFQMALALVLSVGMLYSWLRDTAYIMGLVLGIICALLFLALLLLPDRIMRHTAKLMAENMGRLEFRIYENGVTLYDGFASLSLSGDETAVYENDRMYLFETKSQRIYPLPKRSLASIEKDTVSRILRNYPTFYAFSESEKKAPDK